MCHIKSMIVLKNRVYCPLDHDHHSQMLEELGIRDDFISPDFVRIEMVPKDGYAFNHDRGNWKLKVDQDSLPDWFIPEEAEQTCWEQLERWFSKRFIREGGHSVHKGRWFASGEVHVWAQDKATVYAVGNTIVWAQDKATVYAVGDVDIYADGNATVYAWNNAKIRASGNVFVSISGDHSSGVEILDLKDFAIVRDIRTEHPTILTACNFEIQRFRQPATQGT